ncbi:MAG: Ig-like domain-containing protein, partial [Ignavibacteriales bacterium]|nr:Ig-like domain-containing protein [Ignavibacteriales bacterium]
GQTQPTGSILQTFVVTVRDAYGNAVPDDTVQFAVSAPTGATGYSLTATNAVTDSLGRARTTLRLGNFPGPYVTTATIPGLPPVMFTATATIILADVNSDFDVNIADLTSIIDHIIGRRILTSIDSVKADVNRDGRIDVRDALAIREDLLGVTPLPKNGQTRPPTSLGSSVTRDAEAASSVVGELEMTSVGLRLNMDNDVPMKGIQLYVKLRIPVDANKPEFVFNRAQNMDFYISSQGLELHLVAFNLQNSPIASGSGSIVRLPIKLTDTTLIDSAYAIVSTPDTSFDVAVSGILGKRLTTRPTTFALLQNYPNPFNPSTTIEYDVPELEGGIPRVAIQIFNILGQKVKTIDRGEKDSGRHKVIWDGRDDDGVRVPSGVYFYRLLSEDFATSKKMILLK